jgi:hypothetical protein
MNEYSISLLDRAVEAFNALPTTTVAITFPFKQGSYDADAQVYSFVAGTILGLSPKGLTVAQADAVFTPYMIDFVSRYWGVILGPRRVSADKVLAKRLRDREREMTILV